MLAVPLDGALTIEYAKLSTPTSDPCKVIPVDLLAVRFSSMAVAISSAGWSVVDCVYSDIYCT